MNYFHGILRDKSSALHKKQSQSLAGLPGCTATTAPSAQQHSTLPVPSLTPHRRCHRWFWERCQPRMFVPCSPRRPMKGTEDPREMKAGGQQVSWECCWFPGRWRSLPLECWGQQVSTATALTAPDCGGQGEAGHWDAAVQNSCRTDPGREQPHRTSEPLSYQLCNYALLLVHTNPANIGPQPPQWDSRGYSWV